MQYPLVGSFVNAVLGGGIFIREWGMSKFLVSSVAELTDKQIKEQVAIRLKRMASESNVKLMNMLADSIENGGVTMSEIMFALNECNRDASNRISHTSTTHGLVVQNMGKRDDSTVYMLVGFKEPINRNRRAERKKSSKVNAVRLIPPTTFDARLNQVFC